MSKGALLYPGKGMHLETIQAHEFEGLDGYWHRVELFEDIESVLAASYRRERGNWIPHGCQQCAMEKNRLLSEVEK